MGKNLKNNMNHMDVQHKLTHYKPTILQQIKTDILKV